PRIVELGAGDGTFALRVAQRLRASTVTLLDRAPVVSDKTLAAFSAAQSPATVVRADALDWMRAQVGRHDAIFVNLFLHHLRGNDDFRRRRDRSGARGSDGRDPARAVGSLGGTRGEGGLSAAEGVWRIHLHDDLAAARNTGRECGACGAGRAAGAARRALPGR